MASSFVVNEGKGSHDSLEQAQRRLAENINLLWALNETPELPHECRPHHQCPGFKRRQLTIDHERLLADNLAFIAAYTDDNSKVMAVSIEEDMGGNGMTIRLATNTGDISNVVKGFCAIATILQRATPRRKLRNSSD